LSHLPRGEIVPILRKFIEQAINPSVEPIMPDSWTMWASSHTLVEKQDWHQLPRIFNVTRETDIAWARIYGHTVQELEKLYTTRGHDQFCDWACQLET
jgi:hypothetical protein